MTIKNLGCSAIEITAGCKRIFVDAFHALCDEVEVRDHDLLLFTHNDADHFDAKKLPDIRDKDICIVGPSSIVQPIIAEDKATIGQIKPLYGFDGCVSSGMDYQGITIKSFPTPHFMDWKPVHNSYLLQVADKNIYITGDSCLDRDIKDALPQLDIVVCNLVDEGYIKQTEDKRFAVHHLLSYVLKILSDYYPTNIIGVHLNRFDGTPEAADMKALVEAYGFSEIIIPSLNETVRV